MKQKYLFLKGCAGLGNRFITLLKAIQYAKKTKRTLYVDWADGMFSEAGINAFYKYFTLKNINYTENIGEIIANLNENHSIYPKTINTQELKESIYDNFWHCGSFLAWKLPAYRIFITLLFKGKVTSIFGLQSWQRKSEKKYSWIHNILNIYNEKNIQLGTQLSSRIKSDIVIFTDFRPLINTSTIFNYVELKREYYNRFLDFANKHELTTKAIGIHIRATDKKPKRQLKKLYKKIDLYLNKNNNYKIFLSTDNYEILNELQKKYNGKIITYPKFLPQDLDGKGIHHWALNHNIQGIKEKMFEESLADMWILSMCKILLWQGNSSFSLMSSILKQDKNNIHNWMK